jgi:hypothetical protein
MVSHSTNPENEQATTDELEKQQTEQVQTVTHAQPAHH